MARALVTPLVTAVGIALARWCKRPVAIALFWPQCGPAVAVFGHIGRTAVARTVVTAVTEAVVRAVIAASWAAVVTTVTGTVITAVTGAVIRT